MGEHTDCWASEHRGEVDKKGKLDGVDSVSATLVQGWAWLE